MWVVDMTEIEKISEELAEYGVPDELIGKIENLLATLYGEKRKLEIEKSWDVSRLTNKIFLISVESRESYNEKSDFIVRHFNYCDRMGRISRL